VDNATEHKKHLEELEAKAEVNLKEATEKYSQLLDEHNKLEEIANGCKQNTTQCLREL
jgi:F0F1-type ATP synthase membrane subunit b/b'